VSQHRHEAEHHDKREQASRSHEASSVIGGHEPGSWRLIENLTSDP
jgi:hypothetical protein